MAMCNNMLVHVPLTCEKPTLASAPGARTRVYKR